MSDLETFLRVEATQYNQEQEVDRLLKLKELKNKDPLLTLNLSLSPYLTLSLSTKEIKQQFRRLSLLVHPDKNKHPLARIAFEELKDAVKQLELKEDIILNFIRDARDSILQKQGIVLSKFPKKKDYDAILEKYPRLCRLIQLEFVRLAQELEYRDRTRLKNEVQRELEISLIISKRVSEKEEMEEQWDQSRGSRITAWKNYSSNEGLRIKKLKVSSESRPLGSLSLKKLKTPLEKSKAASSLTQSKSASSSKKLKTATS